MLISDDVTNQFVLSSVVSKYLLLALSALCILRIYQLEQVKGTRWKGQTIVLHTKFTRIQKS